MTFGPGGDVDWAGDGRWRQGGAALAHAAVRVRAQPRATRSRRSRPRARSASDPRGALDVTLQRAARRAASSSSAAASSSSTTATTPTRCRCAPRSTTSPRRRPRRAASRCSGTCSSSGPTSASYHAEIGAARGERGVDVLVAVGPLAAHDARGVRRRVARGRRRRGRRRRSLAELVAPGDTVLVKGVARRRARGRRRRACARRRTPDGRGPHRRHGVAADLHLPVAEVHRLPAQPRVRPAHPRGGPAGAPRQGGHADDGRDHHLHRDLGAVPDAVGLRLAVGRRLRRRARLRAARASPTTTRRSSGAARSACGRARSSSSRS